MGIKLVLIRHGATAGNTDHRYVGLTDEDITETGADDVRRLKVSTDKLLYRFTPSGDDEAKVGQPEIKIYVSPLKRALQTAELLFPGESFEIVDDLKECDFGEFEYKSYEELKDDNRYQGFIDTMGESGFPGGEKKADFINRCCRGYEHIVRSQRGKNTAVIVIVAHGGTIMSIMDRYALPHRDYYDWQIRASEGFVADMDPEGKITDIKRI